MMLIEESPPVNTDPLPPVLLGLGYGTEGDSLNCFYGHCTIF